MLKYSEITAYEVDGGMNYSNRVFGPSFSTDGMLWRCNSSFLVGNSYFCLSLIDSSIY